MMTLNREPKYPNRRAYVLKLRGDAKPDAFAGRLENIDRLARVAPGLPALARYRFAADFRHDVVAGVSVAAVALPVAIAYAQLAGFSPVVGLYSSILPLVAYALFGTTERWKRAT